MTSPPPVHQASPHPTILHLVFVLGYVINVMSPSLQPCFRLLKEYILMLFVSLSNFIIKRHGR